jgi:hypothetical protein
MSSGSIGDGRGRKIRRIQTNSIIDMVTTIWITPKVMLMHTIYQTSSLILRSPYPWIPKEKTLSLLPAQRSSGCLHERSSTLMQGPQTSSPLPLSLPNYAAKVHITQYRIRHTRGSIPNSNHPCPPQSFSETINFQLTDRLFNILTGSITPSTFLYTFTSS